MFYPEGDRLSTFCSVHVLIFVVFRCFFREAAEESKKGELGECKGDSSLAWHNTPFTSIYENTSDQGADLTGDTDLHPSTSTPLKKRLHEPMNVGFKSS